MNYITKHHNQKLVYWGSPVQGGFGGKTFADPIEIDGRYIEKSVLFIDQAGREQTSRAIATVEIDLDVGGFLWAGELSTLGSSEEGDPTEVDGAYEIKAFKKVPNLKATQFVRKVYLSTYDV